MLGGTFALSTDDDDDDDDDEPTVNINKTIWPILDTPMRIVWGVWFNDPLKLPERSNRNNAF